MRALRLLILAAMLLPGAPVRAESLTLARLQALMQASPKPEVHFTEVRESPWLRTPALSSGTLKITEAGLEKRVDEPRREIWRILPDRMEVQTLDNGLTKMVVFRDAPEAGTLGLALRDVMAGNLAGLATEFEVSLTGDENAWVVQLKPHRPNVARTLKQIELQGTLGSLLVMVIVESHGGRTTTQLVRDECEPQGKKRCSTATH